MDPPLAGARNMARDHALAGALPDGEAALRIYRWERPTLSLGRNEPALGVYDPEQAARMGVDVVRRPSGGRAVLHHRELTYAVALPVGRAGELRRSYRAVNAGLVRALRSLGVDARMAEADQTAGAGRVAGAGRTARTTHAGGPTHPAGPTRPAAPDAGPCFQLAAAGEVTCAGRKLVGSAQVRLGGRLLQHGSLLLAPGQDLIGRLRVGPADAAAAAPSGAISLAELLDPVPSWGELVGAVTAGLRAELGGCWGEGPEPIALADEARWTERYASSAWTWRR